jgi:hypothetical protein
MRQTGRTARSAWCVEDAAAHHGGGAALPGPPQVSVRSFLETSITMAMRRFD